VYGQGRSIFDGLGKNWAFAGISLVILVGQILIVQFGGEMFRTEPLTLTQWLWIVGGTSIVALINELIHWIKKLFGRSI
jgi:Ca2+-transporting ATPase